MIPSEWAVLSRYPVAIAGLNWVRLGSAGGFSGAAIWRGEQLGVPAFCLKEWPSGFSAGHLSDIHRIMTTARVRAGLEFVPVVVPALNGQTDVVHAGRTWDVTAWMPGTADFHGAPSDERLRSAVTALAALHLAWSPPVPQLRPCPGVARRLAILDAFEPGSVRVADPQLAGLVHQALELLPRKIAAARAALRPWLTRAVPVQPCLCDVWHDHVLFTGDTVTGLIDYGEVKLDNPAVDLARLLGDLVGDDEHRFRQGMEAYREAIGSQEVQQDLVRLLDTTGVICSVIHWIETASRGPVGPRVAARLSRLHSRLLKCQSLGC